MIIFENSKHSAPGNKNPPSKKIVSFKVKFVSPNTTNFNGFIEHLSKDGIYMKTAPLSTQIDFTPGKIFQVEFQPLFGEILCRTEVCKYHSTCVVKFQPVFEEKLSLQCKVKWSYKTPPHGLTNSIGMEVIEPHPVFEELLKTLG